MSHKLIKRFQEIESLVDIARNKQNYSSKYETMFVTALKNITKSNIASEEYEEIYESIAINDLSGYI